MTDNERLEKLEQAVRLLREVEFSYDPPDHPIRKMMYKVMVECFSLTRIGELMSVLKKAKWAGQSDDDPEFPRSGAV